MGVISHKPADNVSVEITINQRAPGSGKTRSLVTDSNGKFNFTLDASDSSSGLREDWNWLWANANCDPWFGEIAVTSHGYVQFKISPEIVTPQPTEPPAAQPQPIAPPQSPTDKIPVPNVVGMSFEDAQTTLENLGFNTTWIDGTSNLELGKIYSQAPAAGILSVPHRTTVVLYRTTEVVTEPPECAQFNLTPEECANAKAQEYSIIENCNGFIKTDTYPGPFQFTGDGTIPVYPYGFGPAKKVRTNTYSLNFTTDDQNFTYTYIFTTKGFTDDIVWTSPKGESYSGSCHTESTITK